MAFFLVLSEFSMGSSFGGEGIDQRRGSETTAPPPPRRPHDPSVHSLVVSGGSCGMPALAKYE